MKNSATTALLRSNRFYILLFMLGYAVLALIHWRHSWPALSQGQVFPDLGDSRLANPALEVSQTLTLLYLFGLYILCLVNWKRRQFTAREVVVIIVGAGLLAWGALPANSTDIFGYIAFGRMAGIYGANPYVHTYSEFADFYSAFVEWDITMPYGPVGLPLFILVGRLSEHSVLGSVFVLKLIWLLTHFCNCWLLFRILKAWQPDPTFGLFLFGLNPLVLVELMANGHNDGLMILFVLLAIFALQRERHTTALWLAMLAALVKLPGILVWVAFLFYLLRRRAWRALSLGMLLSIAILLMLRVTLFPSAESLISLTNAGPFTKNSFHELLIEWSGSLSNQLGAPMGYETLYSMDRYIVATLFSCFCLWRFWRIDDRRSLIRELGYIFLALLIGYAAWFFPWYVTWLLPLAALTEARPLRWAIVIFSWTALALYAFPNYVVTEAPLHRLWAVVRIFIVHLSPLVPLMRGRWWEYRGIQARQQAEGS